MRYQVTKTAGIFVAGVRSPGAGEAIDLTEEQAAHPLRLGHIEVATKAPAKAKPAAKPKVLVDEGSSDAGEKDE